MPPKTFLYENTDIVPLTREHLGTLEKSTERNFHIHCYDLQKKIIIQDSSTKQHCFYILSKEELRNVRDDRTHRPKYWKVSLESFRLSEKGNQTNTRNDRTLNLSVWKCHLKLSGQILKTGSFIYGKTLRIPQQLSAFVYVDQESQASLT